MSEFDDWYASSTDLEQGSVLRDLPFLKLDADQTLGTGSFTARDSNFVVLTQTCDIPKPAQRDLLLAEVWPYDLLAKMDGHLASSKGKDALAQGTTIAEFLLPPSDLVGLGWSVVSFRSLYVLPKKLAETHGTRVRVSTPYREHLAQAYARFTMRVGLPSPLHAFKEYKPSPS